MPRALSDLGLWLLVPLSVTAVHPCRAGEEGLDFAFEKNLDLLHVQMKLRVLSKLGEEEFFIPRPMVRAYLDVQTALCQELDQKNRIDLDAARSWATEAKAVRKAEKDTMEKLAEGWGRKYLLALVEKSADKEAKNEGILTVWRNYELKMIEWKKKDGLRALDLARDVEALIRSYRLNAGDQPGATAAEEEWRQSIKKLYRGAIQDTGRLIEGIVEIERQRMYLEGCLKLMGEVENGLKLVEWVRDETSFKESMVEKGRDKLTDYLKKEYGQGDKETETNIKWTVDKVYGCLKKGWEAWDEIDEMEKDPLLKANPLALRATKKFAVLGAIYTSVLDVGKDFKLLAPLKPMFEVLEYYGKAMALVPELAKKMQGFVNKVDQGYLGFRTFSVWGEMSDKVGPFWETSLMKHYNIQIATGGDQMEGVDGAKYYLIVDTKVVPRGYATLDRAQYDRIAQALADERILFARKEASRSVLEGAWENLFDWQSADILATTPSPAFISSVKKAARKMPFTDADLLALAQGNSVKHKDKDWTAASLRSESEREIDALADQLAARTALPHYRHAYLKDWYAFKDLLRQYPAALGPEQILHLFTFAHQNAFNEAHLRKYLEGHKAERSARQRGEPRAGVPLLRTSSVGQKLTTGSTARLTAEVIVADMRKGRTVAGQMTWTLPPPLASPPPQEVTLSNGVTAVTCEVALPKSLGPGPLEALVEVKIPIDPGESALAMAAAALGAPLTPPAPALGPPANDAVDGSATNVTARQYRGHGSFEVDARTGPLSIEVHPDGKRRQNHVIVTSESLAALDPRNTDVGLGFTLYRAVSPNGPWMTVGFGGAFPGLPLVAPGNLTEPGQISKDQVRLLDQGNLSELPGHLPVYYQVGQQLRDISTQKEGPETKSAVTGLGQAVLRPTSYPALIARFPDVAWLGGAAALALESQCFDVPGAHFMVTTGGWTGHSWSPGAKGKSWMSTVSAPLPAPRALGGQRVSIRAEGGGFSATAEVDLPGDPGEAARIQPQIDAWKKDIAGRVALAVRYLAKARQLLPYWEEAYQKMAPDGVLYLNGVFTLDESSTEEPDQVKGVTGNGRLSRNDTLRRIQDLRQLIERYQSEGSNTLSINYLRTQMARLTCDHRLLLETAQSEAQRIEAEGVRREKWTEGAAERGVSAADIAEAQKSNQISTLKDLAKAKKDVADAALLAGDSAAHRAAVDQQIAALQKLIEFKEARSSELETVHAESADGFALLTGDREAAAAQYRLSGRPIDKNVPDWWPEK